MKANIQKTIISAVILFIGLVLTDISIGIIGSYMGKILPDFGGETVKKNYILTRLKGDVLIFGSSEVTHGYISNVIKTEVDSLFKNDNYVYNASVDGTSFATYCCWAESALERCSPKLLIIDCRDASLCSSDLDLVYLYPYYNYNSIVKDYMKDIGWKEKIKLSSNLYRYNSELLKLLNSLKSLNIENDGYLPIYAKMSQRDACNIDTSFYKSSNKVNIILKEHLINIIKKSKEKNTQLIITSCPYFGNTLGNPIISNICKQYDIPYIDFSHDTFFNKNHELFKDKTHLNNDGATEFTNRLCIKIDSIFDVGDHSEV